MIQRLLTKINNFAKNTLSNDQGNLSTMRLLSVLTILIILTIYITHNVVSMVKGLGFVDFPENSVMVILITFGAKVSQSFSERFKPSDPPNQ